jgi:hypothetical protein
MKKVKKAIKLVEKMDHSMVLIDVKSILSSNLKGGYGNCCSCFSQSLSNMAE